MEASAPTIESIYQELMFLNQDLQDPKLKLILLIHACNLVNGLKCTGLLEDDAEGDFVLPPNWNKDSDGVYSFRYFDPISKDTVFLKIVTEENTVDINAVTASKNDKIFSLGFLLSDFTNFDSETINQVNKRYKNEFLVQVLPRLKPAEEEKKKGGASLIEEDPRFFNDPRDIGQRPHPYFNDPLRDYGKQDLYPGGLNNPFGKPATNVNPRIRYDPTGPNDIDPSNPDPDNPFPDIPFNNRDPRNPFGGGPFGRGPFGGGNGPFGGGGGFGGGGFGGGFI